MSNKRNEEIDAKGKEPKTITENLRFYLFECVNVGWEFDRVFDFSMLSTPTERKCNKCKEMSSELNFNGHVDDGHIKYAIRLTIIFVYKPKYWN